MRLFASATRLLPALLLFAAAGRARADAPLDTLASLDQRVVLETGGEAVLTTTLVLATGGPARAFLPFGFGRADSFRVSGGDAAFAPGGDGRPAPLQTVARRTLLVLDLGGGARAGDTVRVSCRLSRFVDWDALRGEFGAYPLSKTFVNDADVSLGRYRLAFQLPPGFKVRRITGTEPAFKPEVSPEPPFAVGRDGGADYAEVHAKHLRPGGRAQLGMQAERSGRGPVPLLWGLAIGLGYLWFFRDGVARRRPAAATALHSAGSRT